MLAASTTRLVAATGRRAFSSTATSNAEVGFIGLGNMGGFMSANLLKEGHTVTVFDVAAPAVDKAVSAGASSAATPKEVAAASDVVITMLPSNPHVREVYCGADGVLEGARAGSIMIDSSTIDPNVAREVAASVAAAGSKLIDAPVSGGVGGAEAGTLTFMVGGDTSDLEAARPVLEVMGANIVHCGDVGTGQVAKLCNNLVLGISMAGVAEAMNMGARLGIDEKTLAGIMNTSTARCWSSDTYNPCPGVMEGVPASRDYEGGFGAALMQKDLGLALDAARAVGATVPMGANAHQIYSLISAHGAGGKDFGVVFKFLQGDHVPQK